MKRINKIIVFVLLIGITAKAQMSNTGTMTVNPNTVMGVVSSFDNTEQGTLLNDGEVYWLSHFNNDGITTFSPNGKGNMRFEGWGEQKITGNFPVEFKNVLFHNTSDDSVIELHNEISIAGHVDFSQGIVKNRDFGGLMIFEQGAQYSNAGNESYVEGKIKKNGGESFVFPTGHNGNYRHAGIDATNEVLSSFMGSYFKENSNSLYPHKTRVGAIDLINDQEYWTIEKKGGTANAILTLSWDEMTTTPSSIIDDPDRIIIVRWDEAKKYWVNEGGITNVNNKTVSTPISVSGYGIFTLARATVSGFGACNKLIVYNAVSPDGDGLNDYFRIDGLKACTNGSNKVMIFNRWGMKVFETRNYGENGNVFDGHSNVKNIISGNKLLVTGTYFYVIEMDAGSVGSSTGMSKTGYLYIN